MHNHLPPTFDSRFWIPLCEAMDTFTRSWSFDSNWVFPPLHLVPRAVKHMSSCCAQSSLIVPRWCSAPFWPLLTSDGLHLPHFVEGWVDLLPLKTTFCMGRHSTRVFGREDLNFTVVALRTNLRSARFSNADFCTIVQGWCSRCSSASVWQVVPFHFFSLFFWAVVYFSGSGWLPVFFSCVCYRQCMPVRWPEVCGWSPGSQWVAYAFF